MLVAQAAWIALSGRYPMAFDEDFHLGVIKLYAHHPSPFWSYNPPGTEIYGPIARDPSYLYHLLMSWPYRLISLFTHNQVAQVMLLRAINIGLFASGLVLFRKLLGKVGASRAMVNVSLLAFVLIPVVPMLAAQINYDNLFVPAVGLSLLLTVNFAEELRSKKRVNLNQLALLVTCILLASLVKYAFLPLLLVIAAYVVWELVITFRGWRKIAAAFRAGLAKTGRRARWTLLLAVLLALGLFTERYGVNMVRYHKPVPDCNQVLSLKQCRSYGPWVRDYDLAAAKKSLPPTHDKVKDNPIAYTTENWFYGMWLRLFFTLNGPVGQFETRGPFPVPAIGAIVFFAGGFLLLVRYWHRILKSYNLEVIRFFMMATLSYIIVLWVTEYQAYLHTGQPVAVNGRYLLPVLPLILVLIALAYARLLAGRPRLKPWLAGLAIACLLWGGGALTFILRSNDNWLWDNSTARHVNYDVRTVVGPLVPGYRNPIEFLR